MAEFKLARSDAYCTQHIRMTFVIIVIEYIYHLFIGANRWERWCCSRCVSQLAGLLTLSVNHFTKLIHTMHRITSKASPNSVESKRDIAWKRDWKTFKASLRSPQWNSLGLPMYKNTLGPAQTLETLKNPITYSSFVFHDQKRNQLYKLCVCRKCVNMMI